MQEVYEEPNRDLLLYARQNGVSIWKIAAHPSYNVAEPTLRYRMHRKKFDAEQRATFMRVVDEIKNYEKSHDVMQSTRNWRQKL